MTFDIVTIFPAMVEPLLTSGVLGRAIAGGVLDVKVRDLRDFGFEDALTGQMTPMPD